MARAPKTEFAKFRQQVTDEIIAAMETGDAPWQKPWAFAPGSTPHNGFRKNAYRGGNAIWLAFDMLKNNFRDGRYITLNQAAQMGERDRGRAYELRDGERENFRMVEFWKMKQRETKTERDGDDPGADGERADAEEKVGKSSFPLIWRAYRVYHVSQFDGIPDIALPTLTWDPHERAEQLLADLGAQIRYGGNRAFYSLDTDHIQLPRREQFPTADNFYATAMHESVHWSGAPGRTNRHVTLGIRDGETDGIDLSDAVRAKEELRAELGAAFLCAELGIAHDPEQHAAYLKSWIKALKDDRNELFRAAGDASRAADYLLGLERERAIEPEREPSISVTVPDLAAANDPMLEAYYKHMIADWRGFNPADERVVRAFIAQRQRETPRAHHILDVYSEDELKTIGLLIESDHGPEFLRNVDARLDVARAAGIADDINTLAAEARIKGDDVTKEQIEAIGAKHHLARVFASDNGKAILVAWPTLVVFDNATNAWRPEISASLFDRVAQQHRERDRDEQERIAAEPRAKWPSGYIDVDAIRRQADIMDLDRRVADDVLYQLRINPPTASQIVLGYSAEDLTRIGIAADVADLDAQIVERIVDAYNEQRALGIANALTDAVNGFTTEQRTAILLDHNVLTTVTDPEGNDILVQRPYMVSWNGGTRWDVLTDLKIFHEVAEGAIERGAEAMRVAGSPTVEPPAARTMYEVWWFEKGSEDAYIGAHNEQFVTREAAEKWAKTDGKHRGWDARVVEQPENLDSPIHGAALGGADETPRRERPAMDPDKVATRTDLRVHSFISRLTAQERTPGQLWSFCMNEVRALKSELAMTTVRSELTAYRKAIADLDPDHPALAYMRPSRADQSQEAEASRERAYGNLRPTIAEVPSAAFKERTEMLLRSTGNYAALTAGVMAATGRRLPEVVRDGMLTATGEREIAIPPGENGGEHRIIPTLVPAELVTSAWREVVATHDYTQSESREINAKLASPVGAIIKRTFNDIVPGITPKELRPIYAAITFAEANMTKLFVDHYADVLGHDRNNPTAAYGNLKYIADTVDRDAFGENVRASHDVMVERQLAKLDADLTAAARNGIQRDLTHLGWADPAAFIAEVGDPDKRDSVLIVGSERIYSDNEHVRYDHAATAAEAIAKIEAAGSVGFDEMVIGPAARDLATYLDEHRGLPIGKVYLGYEPNAPEPDLAGRFAEIADAGYAVFLDTPATVERRTLADVQNELLAEGKSLTHPSRSSGKVVEIRDDFIVQDVGRDEVVVIDANLIVAGERPAVGANVTFARQRDGNISVTPIVEEEVEIALG